MPCSGVDIITACLRSRSNGRIIYHLVMYVSELLCIWGSDDISLSVSQCSRNRHTVASNALDFGIQQLTALQILAYCSQQRFRNWHTVASIALRYWHTVAALWILAYRNQQRFRFWHTVASSALDFGIPQLYTCNSASRIERQTEADCGDQCK